MSKRKLQLSTQGFGVLKKNQILQIPGVLGIPLNGVNTVEVPNRMGFVYVRLRNSDSEVIQAFNDKVSPVYNLPVLVIRDEVDRSRYRIDGRDLGVYQNWGSNSSYLPKHGSTHSYDPNNDDVGGDVTFIYGKQFMPLMAYPSGTSGGGLVMISPSTYYQTNNWHFAGGTGTSSLLPYKPTGSSARMVLVYIDENGNPGLLGGSTYFSESITGSAEIVPYLPKVGDTNHVPVAGIRLVSGTSVILWDNIYDLRPIIAADGFIATGTFAPYSGNYVVVTGTSTTLGLPNERILIPGNKMSFVDGGSGGNLTVGLQTGTLSGVIGFFVGGDLSVGSVAVRNLAPRDGTIQNVVSSVYGMSTGSSIIVDINRNGVTIFSTQANRPTILAGTNDDLFSVPDVKSFNQNDVFTLDIDEIGVSGSGSGLEIQMRYTY